MNLRYYVRKAKDVKFLDIMSFFPMIIARFASIFEKKRYKDVWAICERKDEARDNGYWFFKYMRENHPEQRCIYVIMPSCKDAEKVRCLGEIVRYGSIRHWILYFCCEYLISSQRFAPNGYLCVLLERSGIVKSNQIFLQHGITKDIAEFLLASHRQVKKFIAGAEPEYIFMKENFGYPDGTIQYTGFARFDALHDFLVNKNRILIMPTWRKWLAHKSEEHDDAKMSEHLAEYINGWNSLINNSMFSMLIEEHKLEVCFYLHPNMKNVINVSLFSNPKIKILDPEEYDLQDVMKTSQLLITDYSSVFFDMAYMRKPSIFFQFDEEKYRKYHYQQGWFDYHNTFFGRSCKNAEEVCEELEIIVGNNYQMSSAFEIEHNNVFRLYDKKNCKRIYNMLVRSRAEK